jgi:hypothetical protein
MRGVKDTIVKDMIATVCDNRSGAENEEIKRKIRINGGKAEIYVHVYMVNLVESLHVFLNSNILKNDDLNLLLLFIGLFTTCLLVADDKEVDPIILDVEHK